MTDAIDLVEFLVVVMTPTAMASATVQKGTAPSAFNASRAAGYAGFLSTFITRGMALPDASIALRRRRLAAAISRLAVSRKSIVCPVESKARYRYLSFTLYLDIRLVDAITRWVS